MKEFLKKLSTSMKLAIVAALLGFIALIIGNPSNKNFIDVNAKEIALSTIKNNDRISVTTLADWLIKGNGDFTLVDLRNEKEFNEYNLPTSVNIKMEDLLNSDLMRNQKILLYGNDDAASAQAWFILKSARYQGASILTGGMNAWKNEILFPKLAANATPEQASAFEKIKNVSIHFGGTPQIISGESTVSTLTSSGVTPSVPKLSPMPANAAGGAKKKKEGC